MNDLLTTLYEIIYNNMADMSRRLFGKSRFVSIFSTQSKWPVVHFQFKIPIIRI